MEWELHDEWGFDVTSSAARALAGLLGQEVKALEAFFLNDFLETTGDHRGQFPRTDVELDMESSPLTTAPGPLKLRLFFSFEE